MKSREHRFVIIIAVLFACALASMIVGPTPASAQVVTTATLSGSVTDASGAVVPGVAVVARNLGTSLEFKATTDQAGRYVILNLLPGDYTMSASTKGFATTVVPKITLNINQSSTQDLVLKVGAVSQEVQVTGAPPVLQTGTASLGTIVDQKEMVDLPLNGRNLGQLILLAPGASPIDIHQDQNTTPGEIVPAVSGTWSRSSMFMLDGVIDSDPFFSGFAISPILDAVQEFDVEAHNDRAEAGGSLGGQENIVTKAGTNAFHGSAYEFNRNKAVYARSFFDPDKSKLPNFNQNQFGVTIGGPVSIGKLKHNTWFYGGYEGYRYVGAATSLGRVPTAAEWNGDFSGDLLAASGTDALGRTVYKNEIFNPYTWRQATAGQVDTLTGLTAVKTAGVRDPFVGNIIVPANLPSGSFNPMINWKEWVPAPNMPLQTASNPLSNNYSNSQAGTNNFNEAIARVDHSFGSSDLLYGRYTYQDAESLTPATDPNTPTVIIRNIYNVGLHWVHNFGSSTVLDLRTGLENVYIHNGNLQPADFATLFHTTGMDCATCSFILGAGPNVPEYPIVSPTGYVGTGGNAGLKHPERIVQFAGDLSKISGHHTIKAGAQFFHMHVFNIGTCPSVAFSTLQTGDPANTGSTGNGLASLELGDPSSALVYYLYDAAETKTDIMGFYAQDSWRVTHNLTFNYGLRWDYSQPPQHVNDLASGFDIATETFILAGNTPPPACASDSGVEPCLPGSSLPAGVRMFGHNGALANSIYDNFGPRLGLAYRINDRTVVRAGAGAYYDDFAWVVQGNSGQATRGAWPYGLYTNPTLNSTAFTVTAQQPVPRVATAAATPFPIPVQQAANTTNKNMFDEEFNLDVQRQVTPTLTLTLGYVGSRGHRTYISGIYNTAYAPGAGAIAPREPDYPNTSGTLTVGRNIGDSWYNGLQFKAEQRLSHGLSYMIAYTWSKSMDQGCSGYNEGCKVEDPYVLRDQQGVSDFDVPQMLVLSYTWALPLGKGKSYANRGGVVSALAGNWQANGITTFYSGAPVSLTEGGVDTANTGNTNFEMPDIIGNPYAGRNLTTLNWLNPSAFQEGPNCQVVAASACRFGDLARNAFRQEDAQTWNFSIFRDFPISERLGKIQFRVESFNLFNHPVFTMGTTNVTSGSFGTLSSATSGRNIQFAGKWLF